MGVVLRRNFVTAYIGPFKGNFGYGAAFEQLKFLRRVLVWLTLMLGFLISAAASAATPVGIVDSVSFNSSTQVLKVSGWAASKDVEVELSMVAVALSGIEVYRGPVKRVSRPDVARATGLAAWEGSGFELAASLQGIERGGDFVLTISAEFSDGSLATLGTPQALATLNLPDRNRVHRTGLLWLALAIAFPLIGWFVLLRARARGRAWSTHPVRQLWAGTLVCLCSFGAIVTSGMGPSNMGQHLTFSPVVESDSVSWLGDWRQIRSDESLVLTPMAVAQSAHRPPFPVVNHLLGADGSPALLVGMTGLPVAHPTALVKPATWGYFLLDLRQALAWHGWWPLFAGFLALWWLLARSVGAPVGAAAVLAATLAAGPYALVWSGWPAYLLSFFALAVLFAHELLMVRRLPQALALGLGLGMALPGFALVLYPAWQVPLVYLGLLLFFGLVWRDRRSCHLGLAQWSGLALALLVTVIVMASWWWDARDAILAMSQTRYPGQRDAVVGGDVLLGLTLLGRGMTNAVTLYRDVPGLLNPSEAGGFIYLLLPLTVGTLLVFLRRRALDAVAVVLLLFLAMVLFYIFVGLTVDWARFSLWGRSAPIRAVLALAVAQTVLMAWLLAQRNRALPPAAQGIAPIWLAVTAAALWMVFSALLLRSFPDAIRSTWTTGEALLAVFAVGTLSFALLRAHDRLWIGGLLFWSLGAGLAFQPVSQMPGSIVVADWLSVMAASANVKGEEGRVAVFGDHVPAMMLAAAGQPVLNGVFYVPPHAIWSKLDPEGEYQDVTNRYQHLRIDTLSLPQGTSWRAESHSPDTVQLLIDPQQFDFSRLPCRYVLAPADQAVSLRLSRWLQQRAQSNGWVLFVIAS